MSKKATKSKQPDQTGDSALIRNIKKQNAATPEFRSTVLPATGVTVTWPGFRSHKDVQKAYGIAKEDTDRMANLYLVDLCTFDGERITETDLIELIPSEDIVHLTNEVFGQGEKKDGNDMGNPRH